MAAAVALELDFWPALQQLLNKKSTFEGACSSARSELETRPSAALSPAAQTALSRTRTLLRSRFTGRPFLVAGRQLFLSAQQAAVASGDSKLAAQLGQYVAECNGWLREEPEGSGDGTAAAPTSTSTRGFLFEGQLSGQEQPPARPASLLEQLLGGAMGQQLAAAAAAAQAQQAAQQQGGSGADSQQQQGQQQEQQGDAGSDAEADADAGAGANADAVAGAGQQASVVAGQPQVAPSAEVMEAIERELDAIAVQIMEETGQDAAAQRAAPPASKAAVARLPVETLTAQRLQQLGGEGTRCPVCMEELCEGDEVQVMPCNQGHVFHPPCLRPWLEQHNSCPTCRHELPTDDQRYERAKVREAEEAEERRGAENALSHNEFLYI